ncbi:hypothetical protein K402DRAFT_216016 [Aulographum hederae CBS 113979]|uniref:Uncharacterized protein n=1 Tax=Aulographum hederae CBS 113979 TaxID=1176131 RepID=A0A6G1GM26_9PEZI|nr:hypothetical protein K402DRAFT_216016 [Aulographum hederae CBS 113979]
MDATLKLRRRLFLSMPRLAGGPNRDSCSQEKGKPPLLLTVLIPFLPSHQDPPEDPPEMAEKAVYTSWHTEIEALKQTTISSPPASAAPSTSTFSQPSTKRSLHLAPSQSPPSPGPYPYSPSSRPAASCAHPSRKNCIKNMMQEEKEPPHSIPFQLLQYVVAIYHICMSRSCPESSVIGLCKNCEFCIPR